MRDTLLVQQSTLALKGMHIMIRHSSTSTDRTNGRK